MKKKYRIVRTRVAGMVYLYQIQVWRWWLPFWIDLGHWSTNAGDAIDALKKHNGGPYIGPLDLIER